MTDAVNTPPTDTQGPAVVDETTCCETCRVAAVFCLADDSMEHHEQTDEFPCSRCTRYAEIALREGLAARPIPAATPGYCPDCEGTGGSASGPCWDCRGTGHPHPEDDPTCGVEVPAATHTDPAAQALRKAAVVAHKGPNDTDATMMRRAAWDLRNGYDAGGSNRRAAIARVLIVVADLIDGDA